MFGSSDDKKTPAAAGEKKGLFGWLRKKPQQEAEPTPPESSPTQPEPVVDQVIATLQVEPSAAPQPVPESIAQADAPAPQITVEPGAPSPQPWLTLPVTEESVALSDEREPHVTPAIPLQGHVHVVPEPVVSEQVVSEPVAYEPQAEPIADILPLSVQEPVLVEPVPEPEPVAAQPVLQPVQPAQAVVPITAPVVPAPAPEAEAGKVGFFARLKQGLSRTSASIGEGMASLFLGKKAIDDDLLEEIETRLLTADVGVEATSVIIKSLTQKVARKQLTDAQALYTSLQGELAAMLKPVEQPLVIKAEHKPFVILVVGVNGAGKTTTIGKLAKKLQLEGKKVMLAAGDTFRAAASSNCRSGASVTTFRSSPSTPVPILPR